MKKIRTIPFVALVLFLSAAAFPVSAAGTVAPWGAAAAEADPDLTVADMLTYAIQDEFLAHGEYAAIMAKFGDLRPFSNIIRSEVNHIAWLTDMMAKYGVAVPADESAKRVPTPATLKIAFETGVQAEVDNIDMYETFLKQPSAAGAANAALRDLFLRLKNASENHLRAFRNQLARY